MSLTKKEIRDELALFIVEGEKELALAPEIFELYYSELTPFIQQLMKKSEKQIKLCKDLIEKVSYRGSQVIGVCKKKISTFEDLKSGSLFLLCESIEKPGNLGGMLRTADAAGISGVIVADSVVDLFNPNVVRASLGAIFCLPIVQTTTQDALNFLSKHKIQICVTTPSAKTFYHEINYTKPSCIVIGSESDGLSSGWMNSDLVTKVKIPMQGHVDSLNASISASIVIYEALRQRSFICR